MDNYVHSSEFENQEIKEIISKFPEIPNDYFIKKYNNKGLNEKYKIKCNNKKYILYKISRDRAIRTKYVEEAYNTIKPKNIINASELFKTLDQKLFYETEDGFFGLKEYTGKTLAHLWEKFIEYEKKGDPKYLSETRALKRKLESELNGIILSDFDVFVRWYMNLDDMLVDEVNREHGYSLSHSEIYAEIGIQLAKLFLETRTEVPVRSKKDVKKTFNNYLNDLAKYCRKVGYSKKVLKKATNSLTKHLLELSKNYVSLCYVDIKKENIAIESYVNEQGKRIGRIKFIDYDSFRRCNSVTDLCIASHFPSSSKENIPYTYSHLSEEVPDFYLYYLEEKTYQLPLDESFWFDYYFRRLKDVVEDYRNFWLLITRNEIEKILREGREGKKATLEDVIMPLYMELYSNYHLSQYLYGDNIKKAWLFNDKEKHKNLLGNLRIYRTPDDVLYIYKRQLFRSEFKFGFTRKMLENLSFKPILNLVKIENAQRFKEHMYNSSHRPELIRCIKHSFSNLENPIIKEFNKFEKARLKDTKKILKQVLPEILKIKPLKKKELPNPEEYKTLKQDVKNFKKVVKALKKHRVKHKVGEVLELPQYECIPEFGLKENYIRILFDENLIHDLENILFSKYQFEDPNVMHFKRISLEDMEKKLEKYIAHGLLKKRDIKKAHKYLKKLKSNEIEALHVNLNKLSCYQYQ